MATIDLSTLKKAPLNTDKPDLDSLTPEQQEALDALAEENEPEGEHVRTAFLVILDNDGSVMATPDIDIPVIRERLPSGDDVFSAASILVRDITATQTAQNTAQMMHQVAMAAQSQMMNQQIAQGLHLPK